MPNKLITSKSMAGSDKVYVTTEALNSLRVRIAGDRYRIHIPKTIIRDRAEYVALDVSKADLDAIFAKVNGATVEPETIPEPVEQDDLDDEDEDEAEKPYVPQDSSDARLKAIEARVDGIIAYLKAKAAKKTLPKL